jgi:hypothetical protein
MNPKWTVYRHIHNESGRSYVGLTKHTMMHRWNQHVAQAQNSKNGRWHFPNAVRKYGPQAFSHEVLQVCFSLEEANDAEQFWIYTYDTRNPLRGFNLNNGGWYKPNLAPKNPWDNPEYRAKCLPRLIKNNTDPRVRAQNKIKMQNIWKTPGFKEKYSLRFKGLPLKPEHCAKLSQAGKGKVLSLKIREKLSNAQKGKPRNPESIAKSAASRKGKVYNPEHLAKIQSANKGKKRDPEIVTKIAEILKNRPKITHCKHGHSLDDAYIIKGRRFCRSCQHRRSIQYYQHKNSILKLY